MVAGGNRKGPGLRRNCQHGQWSSPGYVNMMDVVSARFLLSKGEDFSANISHACFKEINAATFKSSLEGEVVV